MIVFFGNGVLGGEPQILLRIYGIAEACSCKALDRLIRIVDTLNDTCSIKIMDQFTGLSAVCCSKYQFCLTGAGYLDLSMVMGLVQFLT